jgi:hypothetical protein
MPTTKSKPVQITFLEIYDTKSLTYIFYNAYKTTTKNSKLALYHYAKENNINLAVEDRTEQDGFHYLGEPSEAEARARIITIK